MSQMSEKQMLRRTFFKTIFLALSVFLIPEQLKPGKGEAILEPSWSGSLNPARNRSNEYLYRTFKEQGQDFSRYGLCGE